jgi:AI-2 transport protein TqsA
MDPSVKMVGESAISNHNFQPLALSTRALQFAQSGAYVVIILWGVRMASEILSVVLLGMLLGYTFLPLGRWFMTRSHGRKGAAIASSLAAVVIIHLVVGFYVWQSAMEMKHRLPEYRDRFQDTYRQVESFLQGKGIRIGSFEETEEARSERLLEAVKLTLPRASNFLSKVMLIMLLGFVFLAEMLHRSEEKRSFLAERLDFYGAEMEAYVTVTAKKGAITSLANLVLLAALGVDFPILWAVLSFFLGFIPNFGFVLTLLAPTAIALFALGWQKAVLVAAGLLLINTCSDYLLAPRLLKKVAGVSFRETLLALIVWGFLLGPAGGILAIPLTLALKKLVRELADPVVGNAGSVS